MEMTLTRNIYFDRLNAHPLELRMMNLSNQDQKNISKHSSKTVGTKYLQVNFLLFGISFVTLINVCLYKNSRINTIRGVYKNKKKIYSHNGFLPNLHCKLKYFFVSFGRSPVRISVIFTH